MAVAVLQPLLDTVDSKLGYEEKERYLHEIKSVYGETYSKQSDFRSTLNLLARENKINIENTRILEDFVAGSKNEQEIKYELEKFKHENREEISKYQLERESKDFIGRDVNELEKKVNLHAGVILWGASGVGKTKFAEQMLKSWKGEAIKIDLRGLDTMGLIYVATLESFGKPSSEDQDELADGFAEMLKGIISISNRKIKIIATSREKSMHPLAVDNFYQEELTPLEFKDSSSMIDKGMIHGRENDALIKKATEYCQNHPLNLKILAARLQELGCSLEDILQHIEKEAKKWKKQNENTTRQISLHLDYDDLQLVAPFVTTILDPHVRLEFFTSLAKQSLQRAITASRIGLTLREKLYPDGHTDLVHSYITTGNGYNMKKDLCEKKSKEWRESVKLALEYYEKALEISRHIYKSDLHFDVPQIYENIGTIQHQYEKYDDAERSFKKALEIEKEMKLDGLFNTTTKLVNLGALYQRLRKGDEAFECYRKATEIRKSLKGPHKDTVLTIYRMAEIKRLVGNFSEAVEYYKEAFEMEETLPSNYHSSVREKIRIQLIKCMEMSLKRREGPRKIKMNIKSNCPCGRRGLRNW
eukprot:gene4385-4969_t